MSDVDVQNNESVEAAPEPVERPMGQPIESRFLFVDVAALRAKQLRRGAKSRLEPATEAESAAPVPTVTPAPGTTPARKFKAERVAMQEVRQRLVEWQLPDFKAVFDTR
jgi:DNA-directed RNA polymerase subunit K/omega